MQEALGNRNKVANIYRAWAATGSAVRMALAFGLHTYSQSSNMDPKRKAFTAQTWWGVYNLDALISSMTGRPSMLRSEDISTPLPSELTEYPHPKEGSHTPAMTFPDTQVRLAFITQDVVSKLYTERRVAQSWTQLQEAVTLLMSDLDDWAAQAMPKKSEKIRAEQDYEIQQVMLIKEYHRARIFITRPALRRIEQCFAANTDDFTVLDLEAAKRCIQTAQDVASLYPEEVNLQLVYETGPWWSIIHNSKCPHLQSKAKGSRSQLCKL
jgi:hypothetical protein